MNHPHALNLLGEISLNSIGGARKNLKLAKEYFGKAAELGWHEAQVNLGNLHYGNTFRLLYRSKPRHSNAADGLCKGDAVLLARSPRRRPVFTLPHGRDAQCGPRHAYVVQLGCDVVQEGTHSHGLGHPWPS